MTFYQLKLNDTGGNFVQNVLNFESLEWSKVVNAVGTLTIRAALKTFPWNNYIEDGRVEVYRYPEGFAEQFIGVYFLNFRERFRENGIDYMTMLGVDANHLLTRRIVDAQANSSGASKTGAVDALMKAWVEQELGTGAAADRTMTAHGVTVAATTSLGPSTTKGASRDELLGLMQSLSARAAQLGTPIYFDIEADSVTSFIFRTFPNYRGQYRGLTSSNPLYVSEDAGTLTNVHLSENALDKKTMAYAGGPGVDADRDVQVGGDTTLQGINRREIFQDAVQMTGTALIDEAKGIVRDHRTRITFSGDIVNLPTFEYGVHWKLGDVVVAQVEDYALDCDIRSIVCQYDSNGFEHIQTRLQYVG